MFARFFAVAACAAVAGTASAAIENPSFTSGLTGWAQTGDVGFAADAVGKFAVFGEATGASFSSLSQLVTFGSTDRVMRFDYAILTSGTFNNTGLRDAFTARFLDPATLLPVLATTGRTDYFYHQVPSPPATPEVVLSNPAVVERVASVARAGWFTVSVDVSGLAGQSVLIQFGLLRANNGQSTVAALDHLELQVVPAPSALVLALLALACAPRRR